MDSEHHFPLEQLLISGDFSILKAKLSAMQAPDIAEAISMLTPAEQVVCIRLLPNHQAILAFEHLPIESQSQLLHAMGQEESARILDAMSPDDRTALLEDLPAPICAKLIESLSPDERKIALHLLNYPEDSVGRRMTSEYLRVMDYWTVEDVLSHIRTHGHGQETLNVLYVVDPEGKLLGDLRIKELLLSPLDKRVSEMRASSFIALNATDDQESAVTTFRKYDRTALPVIDSHGGLVGIVTVDDVLDIAEEEATEDIQKLGGMEQLDEPYLTISMSRLVRKRATWLVVLFLGEMLTATAMGHFEDEISRAVVLAMFVPLIISSGGNSGSQAATLIIRAMAVGEVRLRDWWRVMRREILSGITLGLILATIGMLRIALWSTFANTYGPHWPLIMVTVGLSLVGVVLWGSLSGSMLPFILKRLGLDPATSSAPFVATLVDVTGLIIYFAIGGVILRGTLL